MRRYIVLGVLGLTFLMSGCQSNSSVSSEAVRNSVLGQEKRIGVIQSLGGAVVSNKATHLLKMDDGKMLYLKANDVDLANSKYAGKKVEVVGEIVRTTDGGQVMQVRNVDIVDTNTDLSSNQPQWIEYASNNLGITLKYRDDFQIRESDNKVTITAKPQEEVMLPMEDDEEDSESSSPEVAEIDIQLLSDAADFNLAGAMGIVDLNNQSLLEGGYVKSKITKLSLDAYKKSINNGEQLEFYFNNYFSYKITFKAGSDKDNIVKNQNIFYDILASLDFDTLEAHDGNLDTEIFESHVLEQTQNDIEKVSSEKEDDDKQVTELPLSIDGYTEFKSESQKFSIHYPKNYYFAPATTTNAGVSRSYDFGNKPLEEQPGDVKLDIISGTIPAGKDYKIGTNQVVLVEKGDLNEYYVKVDSKVFRLTGPSPKQAILQQMAGSLTTY